MAFDEGGAAVPGAGGEAVAGRSCGEDRSAQTREYAPLLMTGGGGRAVGVAAAAAAAREAVVACARGRQAHDLAIEQAGISLQKEETPSKNT